MRDTGMMGITAAGADDVGGRVGMVDAGSAGEVAADGDDGRVRPCV